MASPDNTGLVTSPMTFESNNATDSYLEQQNDMEELIGDMSEDLSPQYLSSSAPANLTFLSLDSRPSLHSLEDDSDTEDDHTGGISLMENFAADMWDAESLGPPPHTISPYQELASTYNALQASFAQPAFAPLGSAADNPWVSVFDASGQSTDIPTAEPLVAQMIENYLSMANDGYSDWDMPPIPDHLQFMDICKFVRELQLQSLVRQDVPAMPQDLEDCAPPGIITRDMLEGDRCDMQGINWETMNLTRDFIRFERNARQRSRSHLVRGTSKTRTSVSGEVLPKTESFFSFRRMNTAHRVAVPHFQLRNLLAATSRNDIYYAAGHGRVMHTDATGRRASCVMNLSGSSLDTGPFKITSLTASSNVLLAGGFDGEYALLPLSSPFGTPPTLGRATNEHNGITNHVHLFPARTSGAPQAVFSSNDKRLRILDCYTNSFTHSFLYDRPVNCSATSPNGRLRVVVGDGMDTFITDAEKGVVFQELPGHEDDVFACAWADDGIHVATGAQDSKVIVWDARYWARPLTTIRSELSIPRSLRFSPVGGGPRVLFSAEADDFLNIIDATTFDKRQVFDFFGPTGGMTITPDGSSLFLSNTDAKFGGIMEFERDAFGMRTPSKSAHPSCLFDEPDWMDESDEEDWQWMPENHLNRDRRVVMSWDHRRRRGIDLDAFIV